MDKPEYQNPVRIFTKSKKIMQSNIFNMGGITNELQNEKSSSIYL